MSRPLKCKEERKGKLLQARFTDKEFEAIVNAAGGSKKVSDWIRAKLLLHALDREELIKDEIKQTRKILDDLDLKNSLTTVEKGAAETRMRQLMTNLEAIREEETVRMKKRISILEEAKRFEQQGNWYLFAAKYANPEHRKDLEDAGFVRGVPEIYDLTKAEIYSKK